MLKYGNRDFRNLQEQVYANMKNIEDIIKGSDITMDYKLNIVAQVAEAANLPDANTYKGSYGDIYIVGTKAPLDAYVFGKVYENENAPSWIELGEIFVEGPQGPKGEPGDSAGFAEPTASASILAAGSSATVSVVASGPDTAKEFAFTFGIPKGDKGDKGDTGPRGPKGEQGSGTSVSDFVEGTGIVVSSAADNKVELAVDENKVLVTPESAPAAQQLVGISTNGAQNAIDIGAGLEVANGALQNGFKVLQIEATFSGFTSKSTDVVVGADVVTKLKNNEYDLVILKAFDSSNNDTSVVSFTGTAGTQLRYQATTVRSSSTTVSGIPGLSAAISYVAFMITNKPNTTDTLTVARNASTVVSSNSLWDIDLLVNGGTISSTYKSLLTNSKYQVPLKLQLGGGLYLKLYNTAYDNTTAYYRNILDSAHTTQYEVAITLSTGAYTVTQIQ